MPTFYTQRKAHNNENLIIDILIENSKATYALPYL